MKLSKWIIENREKGVYSQSGNLNVIGTCSDCDFYIEDDDADRPELQKGTCVSISHGTPKRCYPDFGCIHHKEVESGR